MKIKEVLEQSLAKATSPEQPKMARPATTQVLPASPTATPAPQETAPLELDESEEWCTAARERHKRIPGSDSMNASRLRHFDHLLETHPDQYRKMYEWD